MANLSVKNAIYGALVGGQSNGAQAFDVSEALQQLINEQGGVVTVDNASFGDPAPGNTKHFGALVNRDKQNLYFACEEGQQIDFNAAGSPTLTTPSSMQVDFAVYGALHGGNPLDALAIDATNTLQAFLDNGTTFLWIFSGLFGSDVAEGDVKHFAAAVTRGGTTYYYACEEGQTIDFANGGGS